MRHLRDLSNSLHQLPHPNNLARLRGEIQDVLPGTVNTIRGAAERVGQVSDLGNPPTFAEDTLNDILQEQEEIPVTPTKNGSGSQPQHL